MRAAIALCALALACHSRPAERAAPRQAAGCRGGELSVDLPAPTRGGPSATLTIDRKGEGMAIAERATCVHIGGRQVRLAAGERRRFAIRADPRALQRLAIGGPLLAHIAPGDDWMLLDQPCFFWQLAGPRTDLWFAPAPFAYCARSESEQCRPGFVHPSPPRPVQDEICGDTEVIRRCAATAEVHFAGVTRHIAPRDCGFEEVTTASEQVGLVVGFGERWHLSLDRAGRLQGEVSEAGSGAQTHVDRG